jgi:hypothetical protein
VDIGVADETLWASRLAGCDCSARWARIGSIAN